MDGVRETFCSSCEHRKVCSYKNTYLRMIESLQEVFYKLPKNETEFMYLKDPDCRFYSRKVNVPKFVAKTDSSEKQLHNGY